MRRIRKNCKIQRNTQNVNRQDRNGNNDREIHNIINAQQKPEDNKWMQYRDRKTIKDFPAGVRGYYNGTRGCST